MEELVNDGLVRHIGLSNFNSVQIDEVQNYCTAKNIHQNLQNNVKSLEDI